MYICGTCGCNGNLNTPSRVSVWKLNSRDDNSEYQTPILMKLASVDRMLKELQSNIVFVSKPFSKAAVASKICFLTSYRT